MGQINMLIRLHKGYGLGDACQVSAVLRHVAKHRKNWRVDYQAEDGFHCVGCGIVANTFAYGQPYPRERYDAEIQICLYDVWAGWRDRPNTRVSSTLHDQFGLDWDAECGRYRVDVRPEVKRWAEDAVAKNAVAFHYKGDSSPTRKNITPEQVDRIIEAIKSIGCEPFVMGRHIERGHDAEVNCALIGECKAFIGIDSGPAKCAAATDTPSLVIWTGHSPAHFFDPAPNVTHLVPHGYAGLYPKCNDQGVLDWFEANHSVKFYRSDPAEDAVKWLEETLC